MSKKTRNASFGIGLFQPQSEIHCPAVGETVRTAAVSAGDDLMVGCSHRKYLGCVASEDGHVSRELALSTVCPLGELWQSFERQNGLDDAE